VVHLANEETEKMIRNHIKKKILEKAVVLDKFGMNDLTWKKDDVKILIIALQEEDVGILGGSVYKVDSGHLVPMYDNWSCDPRGEETRKEFCLRSKIKALEYVEKYPVYPDEQILFSLVFTEDIN